MKRAEILEQARKCVCGEREREYGRPENNFALIGKLWEAYTGMHYSAKVLLTWPVTPPAPVRSPRRHRRPCLSTPVFPAALKSLRGSKFAPPA